MSENTERDTHFHGFADLVAQDIGKNVNIIFDTAFWPEEYYLEAISRIIAQRAYDLVAHTVFHIDPAHLDVLAYEEIPPRIPDITEWPETVSQTEEGC